MIRIFNLLVVVSGAFSGGFDPSNNQFPASTTEELNDSTEWVKLV